MGKNKTYHQQCGVAMALSENEDSPQLIAVCRCFFIGKMIIIHFNHLKIYVIFRDDQTPIGCICSSIYPYFSW